MTAPLPMGMGSVFVETTQGRGWTPEELAARAADKIIYIGDQSHPAVQAQARAFKENVKQIFQQGIKNTVLNVKFNGEIPE